MAQHFASQFFRVTYDPKIKKSACKPLTYNYLFDLRPPITYCGTTLCEPVFTSDLRPQNQNIPASIQQCVSIPPTTTYDPKIKKSTCNLLPHNHLFDLRPQINRCGTTLCEPVFASHLRPHIKAEKYAKYRRTLFPFRRFNLIWHDRKDF